MFVTLRLVHFAAIFVIPVVGLCVVMWTLVRSEGRAVRFARGFGATCVLVGALGLYSTHIEPTWLRVDRVALDAPAPGTSDGFRVGVIADIQTDEFGEYEQRAVDTLMAQEADIVFVAGDITQVGADSYDQLAANASDTLGTLDAPAGVFVVSGNTDPSASAIDSMSRAAELTPLNDQVSEMMIEGQKVRLLGIAWPNNRRERVSELIVEFAAASRPDTIDIVLAHSPDIILNVNDPASIDLIVTGHTHGGQVQIPGYGPLWNVTELPREVAGGGLHEVRGVPLYVSTGVGVQRADAPQVRFGVRPSVGVIDIG